jgi:HAD superfamily hydrolase (TIGR01509 family)
MIKGIIFDFGGVFNNAHESMAGFAHAASRFGHTPESLYDLLYHGPAWQAAKLGHMTTESYWREMMISLGEDPASDLDVFLADLFTGEALDQEVVRIAERLHRRYPLALLSNATDNLESLLADRFRIRHLFRVVVNSATAGVAKPDPEAYWLVLAGLGIEAHESLFIDDKPRNVAAAEALGIPSLLFTTAAQLRRDLESCGISMTNDQ